MHYNSASSCSFSCEQTYQLKGNSEIICLSNGSWDGVEPKCVKGKHILKTQNLSVLEECFLVCPNPPVVDYATVKCDGKPSTESDACSYTCNPPRIINVSLLCEVGICTSCICDSE